MIFTLLFILTNTEASVLNSERKSLSEKKITPAIEAIEKHNQQNNTNSKNCDAGPQISETVMKNINEQLGTSFKVTIKKRKSKTDDCIPYTGLDGPVFCEEFFEELSRDFTTEEREPLVAFIIAHELMHIYREQSYYDLVDKKLMLKKELKPLKVNKSTVEQIVYLMEHHNVDWGAVKIIKALKYKSIDPVIKYFNILKEKHGTEEIFDLPGVKNNRINELRIANIKSAFDEGFADTKTYLHTTGFCALGALKFTDFLNKNYKTLPTELASECKKYSDEELKKTTKDYLEAITRE